MPEYILEEFLGEDIAPTTFEEEVDKKISLLYDFCILGKRDKRKEATRNMLLTCQNNTQLDNTVHDILVGRQTLDEVLKRKGFLQ